MINKSNIQEKLNELKPFLQREYFVKSIGLFGSFSDNSFSDESDIDILLISKTKAGIDKITKEIYAKYGKEPGSDVAGAAVGGLGRYLPDIAIMDSGGRKSSRSAYAMAQSFVACCSLRFGAGAFDLRHPMRERRLLHRV
jgi:hypothetical protein